MVIFQLNEIIFNGKSSVLVNLRDVTLTAKEKILPYKSLKSPIKVIEQACEKIKNDGILHEATKEIELATRLANLTIWGSI